MIARLLEQDFPGCRELLTQLAGAEGRVIDDNGTLKLRSSVGANAPVKFRIPAEGSAADLDGMMIHYLLHVVDGRMAELEVYKDDSSAVIEHARPAQLEVFIPE